MNQQQNLKIPSIKQCIVDGHQKQAANHICIHDKCDLNNKWICIKCVLDDKHIHSQQNKAHIIDQEKFHQILTHRQEDNLNENKEKSLKLYYFVKKLRDLVQDINLILQELENELNLQNQNKSIQFVDQMIKITEQDFSKITNEQIGQFIVDDNFFIGYFYQNFKQKMSEIVKHTEQIKSDVDQNYGEQAVKEQKQKNQIPISLLALYEQTNLISQSSLLRILPNLLQLIYIFLISLFKFNRQQFLIYKDHQISLVSFSSLINIDQQINASCYQII
ncbi:hypothetical protein pb186bvf_018326 [Paramecium bursaria]